MERLPFLAPKSFVLFKRAQRFDKLVYVNGPKARVFPPASVRDVSHKENPCANENRADDSQLVRGDSQQPAIVKNRPKQRRYDAEQQQCQRTDCQRGVSEAGLWGRSRYLNVREPEW